MRLRVDRLKGFGYLSPPNSQLMSGTRPFCTSIAQRTASTTLRNSMMLPSPVRLTMRPWWAAMAGSMRSLRRLSRRPSPLLRRERFSPRADSGHILHGRKDLCNRVDKRVDKRITGRALADIEVAGNRISKELRAVELNVDRIGRDHRTNNAARRRRRKQQPLLVQRDGHCRTRVEHRIRCGVPGKRQRLPADQFASDGERMEVDVAGKEASVRAEHEG